jgi:dihydrolipoamide dehydrogenase
MNSFDVAVIGAGPAGVSMASSLADEGLNVAVIDKSIGGNYCKCGSVVSNSLLYISHQFNKFNKQVINFIDFDGDLSECSFNIKKTRKYVESISNKISKEFQQKLESKNIAFIKGYATFKDKNVLEIKGENDTYELISDYIVIATGSVSNKMENSLTSKILTVENIFNLERVPTSVIIVGGGFVGCEYATFFNRLGSKVSIVEKKESLLNDFEPQLLKKYDEILKKQNISVYKNKTVKKIERIGNKAIIFTDKDFNLEAEEVFVAIGRIPNLKNLNLENAGIKLKDGIPKLNGSFQTSNKKVFIIGDATGEKMFVNWAYKSADIVAKKILGNRKKTKTEFIPKTMYIDPEISSVGYTLEEAKTLGMQVATIKITYNDLEKSLIHEFSKLFIKIIFDKESHKIIGAHIMGKGAAELTSILTLLMHTDVKLRDLSQYIFNHPTFTDVLRLIYDKYKEKIAEFT